MSEHTARVSWISRLVKALFGLIGGVAILLALALGMFRLLVAQIPEYQTELKAWVASELGLVVDFAAIDARLGLAGPQLTLREASIGAGEHGGFLLADRAAITLDTLDLVLSRRVSVSRLTLDGVQLTVERGEDGRFRLGQRELDSSNAVLAGFIPESVEVVIRGSQVLYLDRERERSWQFDGVELVIESTPERMTARASARPPAELAAGSIDLALAAVPDGNGATGSEVAIRGEGVDLAALREILPWPIEQRLRGTAEFEGTLEWVGKQLETVRLETHMDRFAIGPVDAAGPEYDSLGFAAEWQGGRSAWQVDLRNLEVQRDEQPWPIAVDASFALERDDDGIATIRFDSDFVRVGDLAPFVRAFPGTQLAEQWALFDPRGDVRDLDLSLARQPDRWDYALVAEFDSLAVGKVAAMPGITGLSGRVEADSDSGMVRFASGALQLDWPEIFPAVVVADSLTGGVVWRQGRDVVRVFSVDLAVGVLGSEIDSSFDLSLPQDGSSATLDLEASLAAVDLVPAKAYLPAEIMPASVVGWLDRAIAGGRGRNVELSLFGPLSSFPFDDGLGQFRVVADIEDATLRYVSDWPEASDLFGRIEFLNTSFLASGTGSVLSNVTEQLSIAIPDMRQPLLTLEAETEGPLAGVMEFLRGAPLIASYLGSDFDRLDVHDGSGIIRARLDLPLLDFASYELDAALEVADGTLGISGFAPSFSEINGTITASPSAVSATGIEAVFLGGPVSVDLARSDEPGYRAVVAIEGEAAADAVMQTFELPHQSLFAGQALWRGRLFLPALNPLATMPPRIEIESNLSGIAMRLPEPFVKPPGEPSNLRLDLQFAVPDRLEVRGNLGATRRFALSFGTADGSLAFLRGAVQFGGNEPRLPRQAGFLLGGQLQTLEIDQWLALAGSAGAGDAGPLFLGADLEIADLRAYGQQLGTTRLRIERGSSDWEISLDSEAIAGRIDVPRESSMRDPIVADMSRVYLASMGGDDAPAVDPRRLPGLILSADEFGLGTRRLGRVEARIEADPRGLRLTEFTSHTEHLDARLSGSWLQGARGSRTTIAAEVDALDIGAALAELGLDPVISGESAGIVADIYWDSAPSGDWLDHLNGRVGISVATGTLREIDPGAGRMVGLMSIAALPRRLLLDFRDVFEEGFAFDEITGDFLIIDGNAYTDNLKFGGPAAEIGVVGRTGLRDRDYQQQIAVITEPGNMLPTVGGLIGGPGVGAALLIFTRLFKEPLKGIGQASYCLTGSWEEPSVERIDNDDSAVVERCAELPREMVDIRDE